MGQDEWAEITEEYKGLADELPNELMMSVEGFDLMRVMHTVEAMDPKMDCGVGYQERRTLEEALQSGAVKEDPTDEEVLSLMKYLYRAEGCYISGFFLPSNVFTCIYFHKRDLIAGSDILYDYIRALCVSIHCFNTVAMQGDVAEEEEFMSLTFGIDCCADITPAEAVAFLEQTLSRFKKKEKVTLGSSSASAEQQANGEAGDAQKEQRVRQEIVFFLEHRIHILRATSHFVSRQLKKADGILKQMEEKLRKALRSIFPEAPTSAEETADVKKPVQVDHVAEDPLLEGMVFREATSWLAQFVVHPPAFPTLRETLAVFERIAGEHRILCTLEEKARDLSSIVSFTEAFSSRRPQPHLLSRSRLMVLLYEQNLVLKKYQMSDLIVQHLSEELGAPIYASLLKNPALPTNYAAAQLAEEGCYEGATQGGHVNHVQRLQKFLDGLQKCILSYLYALLHNRARLRRKISNLFAEWGFLQGIAWECDRDVFDGGLLLDKQFPEEVSQRCVVLSGLVYDLVLKSMDLFIGLGFELELFCNTEIRDMLWYSEYIDLLRASNLKSLYKTAPVDQQHLQYIKRYRKVKSSDPDRILPPVCATRQVRESPQLALVTAEIAGLLKKGLIFVCMALTELNILRDTGSRAKREKYCSPETRYLHRFLPFMHLMKPAFIGYATFQKHVSNSKSPAELMLAAKEVFERALHCVTIVELHHETFSEGEAQEVTMLKMVSKANTVSLFVLNKAVSETQELIDQAPEPKEDLMPPHRAYFDWCYSSVLPVIKAKKVA
eukprot:TRINITY_DN19316_c0_g1_i1.p1 TRINITY_DN19316_c0_g1~~TRINITY_DN19316_c0_g1_i1.p1  ORF type:complete len:779 (+),score=380.29 TRINITY_DN19316_c0_g1_i1:76-2412(+)